MLCAFYDATDDTGCFLGRIFGPMATTNRIRLLDRTEVLNALRWVMCCLLILMLSCGASDDEPSCLSAYGWTDMLLTSRSTSSHGKPSEPC